MILALAFLFISADKLKEEKLNLKRISRSMIKISDSLYACKYEATNIEYRMFLTELKANNKMDDYQMAVVDSEGWQRKYKYAQHDPLVKMYGCHPAYDNYPVVNISQAGAELFCSWLTEKYNSQRRRNFKKVKFRLPTNEEWELAARGGKKDENYPFGNYLRNKDGKYLCNFRPMGDERISSEIDRNTFEIINNSSVKTGQFNADGGTYTVPVFAYLPGSFGLYNMSGNVAEMVEEKGIARGGSWVSTGYDVRIDSKLKFEKSSPEVGFRYFMEVHEK